MTEQFKVWLKEAGNIEIYAYYMQGNETLVHRGKAEDFPFNEISNEEILDSSVDFTYNGIGHTVYSISESEFEDEFGQRNPEKNSLGWFAYEMGIYTNEFAPSSFFEDLIDDQEMMDELVEYLGYEDLFEQIQKEDRIISFHEVPDIDAGPRLFVTYNKQIPPEDFRKRFNAVCKNIHHRETEES